MHCVHSQKQLNSRTNESEVYVPVGGCAEKGRVMASKESFWVELNPAEKARRISSFTLAIGDDGMLSGGVQITYTGYEAVKQRKQIYKHQEEKDYATHNFLQWYVAEQIEEEATAKTILDKINLIGDDKGGLYLFDRDIQQLTVTSSVAINPK